MTLETKPVIACFSGNDPTGGAGIQADIESLKHFNCHALPLITVNTLQDSQGIMESFPVETAILEKQFRLLNEDISISAIKIGMLANVKQIELLSNLIGMKNLPCVIDTIFSSGLGTAQASNEFINAFCQLLLPRATIITPNYLEAKKISLALGLPEETHPEILAKNIANNIQSCVLLTGTHFNQDSEFIEHVLAQPNQQNIFQFTYKRLAGNYHGSGCTLASALSALLAQGKTIEQACQDALDYSFKTLDNAQALAKHQLFPNR